MPALGGESEVFVPPLIAPGPGPNPGVVVVVNDPEFFPRGVPLSLKEDVPPCGADEKLCFWKPDPNPAAAAPNAPVCPPPSVRLIFVGNPDPAPPQPPPPVFSRLGDPLPSEVGPDMPLNGIPEELPGSLMPFIVPLPPYPSPDNDAPMDVLPGESIPNGEAPFIVPPPPTPPPKGPPVAPGPVDAPDVDRVVGPPNPLDGIDPNDDFAPNSCRCCARDAPSASPPLSMMVREYRSSLDTDVGAVCAVPSSPPRPPYAPNDEDDDGPPPLLSSYFAASSRDADDDEDDRSLDVVDGGEEEGPSSPLALLSSSSSSLFRNRTAPAPAPRTRAPAAYAVPRGEGPSAETKSNSDREEEGTRGEEDIVALTTGPAVVAVYDGDRFPASAVATAFLTSAMRNAGDDDDDGVEEVTVEAVTVAVFILTSSIALVLSCSPSSLRT